MSTENAYVSIVPLLQLTEKLLAKEYVKDGVRWATDAMRVWLMPVNTELYLRLRELMRRDLNNQYQRVCALSVPIT